MDVARFCLQSKVVVVVGKGGVGKTTVASALALLAGRSGLDVLVVTLDDSGSLPGLFGLDRASSYEQVLLAGPDASPEETPEGLLATGSGGGRVFGRTITSREALLEYLDGHGLRRVSHRLVQSGALDVVATAIPGIEQVLVLGKVKQLERAGTFDLLILDAPATGHAVSFLTSSSGLVDAARGGPLRAQAEQVVDLLSDPGRCQAILVTIPEETPVNEVIETAYRLEDEVGIALGPVVVNGLLPVLEHLHVDPVAAARGAGIDDPDEATARHLRDAAAFRSARQGVQEEQRRSLSDRLPLPQLQLPYLFVEAIGPGELEELARRLAEEIEHLVEPRDVDAEGWPKAHDDVSKAAEEQ